MAQLPAECYEKWTGISASATIVEESICPFGGEASKAVEMDPHCHDTLDTSKC
jgi:hypothetical protein